MRALLMACKGYSSHTSRSGLGLARVARRFVWPRHANGMLSTTPLDPCARELRAQGGNKRRTGQHVHTVDGHRGCTHVEQTRRPSASVSAGTSTSATTIRTRLLDVTLWLSVHWQSAETTLLTQYRGQIQMLLDAVMASRPPQPRTKCFNLARTRIIRNHAHHSQEGAHAMQVGRVVVREEINLGSRIRGQKMGSKGTKFAESERGVWFSWKRHGICTPRFNTVESTSSLFSGGGKRFCPQILEPGNQPQRRSRTPRSDTPAGSE